MTAKPPRLFISYRTSDGVDKATALARDLNAVFGEAAVFIDKEDLPAGLPWREAVGDTLGDQPVLLLVVTRDTFGARIHDPHDPVRREVEGALAAHAHLIPLLADGVEALPPVADLPASLHSLGERTWRRLRAYDWREDIERLVTDLQALGLQRLEREEPRRERDRRRLRDLALAFAAGALVAGLATGLWPDGGSTAAPGAALSGAWTLTAAPPVNENGSRWAAVKLHVTHAGEHVEFYSEPIDITADPAWTGFAASWKERFGEALERVVWRGEGKARLELGSAPAVDIGLRVETPSGGGPIETGNLRAEASADGMRLAGRLWMNGEQAERAAELVRAR
ncbi:MAG TPA: toll/interleukin-1 receptor domain-containing protein [Burkholderiaceae bacterium]|nr:toll/interleukin-1 receptor domain-containing protein [Burkholderiaceae bacterium]